MYCILVIFHATCPAVEDKEVILAARVARNRKNFIMALPRTTVYSDRAQQMQH